MRPDALQRAWNWLPAFRVVAETQHLPTAAERLHVSPSALSRTIRLLEEALEIPLFNRHGRNLVLNTAGQRLLGAVQEAMGHVDAGCVALEADTFAGPLRISSLGLLTNHFVLPGLLRLKRTHPGLVPALATHRTTEANDRLVQGLLDVAFYYEVHTHPDLIIERLGETTSSVYCGVAHPLFSVASPTLEAITAHEFSVPAVGDSGLSMDGWPAEIPRRVGMQIWLLTTNLEVCLSGALLTVLPDVTALPWVQRGLLRRLAEPGLPPTPLYAARHRAALARSAPLAAIELVGREIDRANAEIALTRGAVGA